MNLKFGVWADYEKKNRVGNPEVQKVPGRPIRRHLKDRWEFARVGPRDRASQKNPRVVGGTGVYRGSCVFFFGKKAFGKVLWPKHCFVASTVPAPF